MMDIVHWTKGRLTGHRSKFNLSLFVLKQRTFANLVFRWRFFICEMDTYNCFRVKSTLLSLENHHLAKIAQLAFPAFLIHCHRLYEDFMPKISQATTSHPIFLSQPYNRRRNTTLLLKMNLTILL